MAKSDWKVSIWTLYDPKIVETIKERRNSLADLADDLERIDKIVNSTDF